jgi:outer membrane protein insertion porin family
VLLNEGDRYNQQLWDLSLLRLNQLGYFEQVKEEDATINTNEREGQIEMTVKLQEKGRQQVSFTGGVSGAQGSFIGISYSTNNLFGYGESLSFSVSAGNQQQAFSLGITEPYLKGRPISVGFNLFYQNYQFFGQGFGRTQSTADLFNNYGGRALFNQKTAGVSVSTSAPLQYFTPRFRMGRFVRLGLSYTYSINDISDPDINNDEDDSNDFIPIFRQSGVEHSSLSPTISYNTLNSSLDPTAGQSLTLGMPLSGGVLGGDVNTLAPYVEWKIFRPLLAGKTARSNPDPSRTRTFGFRASFGHISPFGNQFKSNSLSFIGGTPTASRFYLGGEESIRGYNIRSIATLVPVEQTTITKDIRATDASGKRLKVRPPNIGTSKTVAPSALSKFDEEESDEAFLAIGGDTQLLFNFEYRIPLLGPLQFVPFADVGSVFNLRRLDNQFISSEFRPVTLNSGLPVTLNPRGELATAREIAQARTPETPAGVLPPGFRSVFIEADRQNNLQLNLKDSYGGLLKNYRYSVGGEFRIQVPVINVPFRLIFAWNPNAKVDNQYLFEEKKSIRFSIGRTF